MERRAITIRGIVQGVGFRPFVYSLASRFDLSGFVKNQTGSVFVEVEGEGTQLDHFLEALQKRPPPLSRIDELCWTPRAPVGDAAFRIASSDVGSTSSIFISPDVATCPDCLRELLDPVDRRSQYPFLNCTNCGPRLTIIRSAPYDRERTTMAAFEMCSACRAEYEDPNDRRFHAQPTACPECGPHLEVRYANGERIGTKPPLTSFVAAILQEQIGALKGLGGFHLVCDARNETAVRELRRRKQRDEKPFAVMVRNATVAEHLCEIDAPERELLECASRPIVLLRKRANIPVANAVAPGNPYVGVMLPYTPLHHLLMEAVHDVPLVMTSGNRSDEPIAYENADALGRLADVADIFLFHNRAIHVRCDDSVTRIVGGVELPVRRSRGYAPQPLKLHTSCPCPILAVGGQFKNTFALGRERRAFLSHHMGDLDHFEAFQAFERDIRRYEQLFDLKPELLVHDLHPDYASTGYARQRCDIENIQTLAVQHHHAHMAACMVEHGLDEPVIGVSFDGTGYGTDAAIWGGEFLVGDYMQFQRAAHLRYVCMPGGDKAIREPWRMAISHMLDAECGPKQPITGVSSAEIRIVEQMIERGFNSPMTSSAGRLFDAVAAITGVRKHVSYEGQAAMQLEWLATDVPEDETYPFDVGVATDKGKGAKEDSASLAPRLSSLASIDTRPLIRGVLHDIRRGVDARVVARRFHSTLVEMIAVVCGNIRASADLDAVVLSGGVFMNALLTCEVSSRLKADGFRVFRHKLVPPNDGGLSLGQLAVAAATVQKYNVERDSPANRVAEIRNNSVKA